MEYWNAVGESFVGFTVVLRNSVISRTAGYGEIKVLALVFSCSVCWL